ncbi:hypothetical protein [Lewinella cohaerens]|uniref:hypothetical protein n=1 Tax=Lewinella cohaerens TaxID=70995 RepID=UPI00037A9EB4|nr:hypothetical protein [Lewinella cohaerens]
MKVEDLQKASEQTNDCIIAARELYSELVTLLRYLEKARGWSIGNLFGGSFFKVDRNEALSQVNTSAKYIKRLNRRYQMALGELSVSIKSDSSIAASKVVLDMIVGNTVTEWIVHNDIVKAIKQNRWCLSELDDQIVELEKQEVVFEERVSIILRENKDK